MTRKARLQAWAAQLNAPVPADANVAQLEQAIETAIASPSTEAEPLPSFTEALSNNWQVIRSQALPTVRAIAANLRGLSHG